MRLLFLAVLLVGFSTSSCEKYKLKQPAYLHFKWNFFEQSAGEDKAVIEGGYFYLKDIRIHGVREEGPDVAIEQTLPLMKTSFSAGGDLYLTMDIPVGDYKQFELNMNVVDELQPCLVLFGTYTNNGISNPFRIEWSTEKDLTFHPATPFSLEKKKNYDLTVGLNVQKLLNEQDWSLGTMTNENGVHTYVIRSGGQNDKLFMDIDGDLQESLVLTIQ